MIAFIRLVYLGLIMYLVLVKHIQLNIAWACTTIIASCLLFIANYCSDSDLEVMIKNEYHNILSKTSTSPISFGNSASIFFTQVFLIACFDIVNLVVFFLVSKSLGNYYWFVFAIFIYALISAFVITLLEYSWLKDTTKSL